ncbi:hypothetical protein AB7M35_001697 [Amorphus suaedae]
MVDIDPRFLTFPPHWRQDDGPATKSLPSPSPFPPSPITRLAAQAGDTPPERGGPIGEYEWLSLRIGVDPDVANAAYGRTFKEFKRILAKEAFEKRPFQATDWISLHQFEEAYRAIGFANLLGFAFNVELTLGLEAMGCHDEFEVEEALKSFFDRLRNWNHQRGSQTVYIAILENGPKHGLHTHAMLHIPADRLDDFGGWIKRTARTLPYRPNGTLAVWPKKRKRVTELNQLAWFRYIFKGLDKQVWCPKNNAPWAQALKVKSRDPGRMTLKRVRISESLSERQQNEAGFVSAVDFRTGAGIERFWSLDAFHLDPERVARREAARQAREMAKTLNDLWSKE